ncbi:MAG: hypothetical protein ACK5WR_00645 [Planctomycetaceae bacterium]
MSHDQGSRAAPLESPALVESQARSGAWFGLERWAVVGFLLWLLIMGYLLSLERQMPTTWVKLGLPLLAPNTWPIASWNPSAQQNLRWGLLVDDGNLLLYPLVFHSLLTSIARGRQRAGKCCASCFRQASNLALLALPFDLVENLCLHRLIDEPEPSGGLLRLLTLVSLFKLALAFVSLCWLLVGLVLKLQVAIWPASPEPRSGDSPTPGQVARRATPENVEGEST